MRRVVTHPRRGAQHTHAVQGGSILMGPASQQGHHTVLRLWWWGPGPLQRIFAHFVITAPLPACLDAVWRIPHNHTYTWQAKLARCTQVEPPQTRQECMRHLAPQVEHPGHVQ
jgi:hypothetical protein